MNLPILIKQHCATALSLAYPKASDALDISWLEVTNATQEKFGHYQLNSAMKLAKLMGEPPRKIAETLTAQLKQLPEFPEYYSEIDIAGPGFINFHLNPRFIEKTLSAQLSDPRLGVPLPEKRLKVIVDFSSPNIAKEMHVGHLRSTIIGDSLSRILSFLGHDVLRLNHVGDWGTQFGMLIAYLKSTMPAINAQTLATLSLSNLLNAYQAAKKLFDTDTDFKQTAQLEVVKLQSGGVEQLALWRAICDISRIAYNAIYDLLDVQLVERGESFYNPLLPDIIQTLEQQKLLQISEGAKCIFPAGFTNREGKMLPLILQKSDGGYNYATTDMAALKHRLTVEQGDWLIYVTDAGQSLHFNMVFAAGEKAHFYDPAQVRLDHVPFGLVLKTDGKKCQTRSGDTERLIDLIHTAMTLAAQKLTEHNPEISPEALAISSKILGINAIKYADLSCHRLSDYVFSYEKMLKFEGNTAAFLLYAYVRIQSIQRKTGVDIANILDKTKISLEEPIEISLALLTCQFSEVLNDTVRELLPNRLTDYLYRLAEKFHVFFHQCRVEGSPKQNSRLLLCEAVAKTLHQGMQLLGLKPLEKM
jgi:arginyl-tRNA synthetase